jgi:hypothetical protein
MPGIYESIPAAPEEVEAFAETLTKAYLRCRVWGHDRIPNGQPIEVKDVEHHPTAFYEASLRCSHRCGVKWKMLLTAEYDIVTPPQLDYKGAPGYLSTDGRIDRKGKAILRKHYFLGLAGA